MGKTLKKQGVHTPREYTQEEMEAIFLGKVREEINRWEEMPERTVRQKLEGLALTILAILDGEGGNLPGFIVAPLTHHNDKQYSIDKGENYYPENHQIEGMVKADIAGQLHNQLFKLPN